MAVVATQIKKGQCISYKGESGIVLHLEHRTPGKGNALIMATIRSFQSGKTKDIRFASGDKVDLVNTERQKLEFSYSDPSGYHFMDPQTFETITLSEEMIGDIKNILIDALVIEVLYLDGKPVSVDPPPSVDLKIAESAPGVKGDTANNPTKEATLETGLRIQVPLFCKPGDVIKVDSATCKYLSRA